MIRLLIALVAIFLFWKTWRVLSSQGNAASRERWRKRGLYALGAILIALGMWLAATGKFHVAWVGGLGLLAWLKRGMLFYNIFHNLRRGGTRAFGKGRDEGSFRQRFDEFFRKSQDEQRTQRGAGMTRKQAARLLGVSEQASRQEISKAFRSKMRAAHPDVGGDEKIASRLNAARDLLLRS